MPKFKGGSTKRITALFSMNDVLNACNMSCCLCCCLLHVLLL